MVGVITAVLLTGCSTGENEGDVMKWACSNSLGWLVAKQEGYPYYEYEQSANEMYIHALEGNRAGEDWDMTEDVSSDLVGWYESGNAFAVDAFVEVNDCIEKMGE